MSLKISEFRWRKNFLEDQYRRRECYLSGNLTFQQEFILKTLLREMRYSGNLTCNSAPDDVARIGCADGYVTSLIFAFPLSATIPTRLSLLTDLQTLVFRNDSVQGTLPTELGKLKNLRTISIFANSQLSGTIPTEIFTTRIVQIKIASSYLSGTIPTEIAFGRSLEFLDLSDNSIDGKIPTEIGELRNLSTLVLSTNQLTNIPAELTLLTNVLHLDLSSNNISGTIPSQFFTPKIQYLSLSGNVLTGTIPSIQEASVLADLFLHFNSLSGTIPAAIWVQPRLKALFVADNFLSGTLPNAVSPTLQRLFLSRNSFSGSVPSAFFSHISLTLMDVSNNELEGNISTWKKITTPFIYLGVGTNHLVGNLADSIFYKQPRFILNVANNLFDCPLPEWCDAPPHGNGACSPCVQLPDGPSDRIQTKWLMIILFTTIGGFFMLFATLVVFIYKYRTYQRENPVLEISEDEVVTEELIGSGHFGDVYIGRWRGTLVAIKQLREDSITSTNVKDFLKEAKVMRGINPHPNVVQFLGIMRLSGRQTRIVTEYVTGGNLQSFLVNHRESVNLCDLIFISSGVAAGMHHISSSNIVHKDLAARNVLIEEKNCSIHGQSRKMRPIAKISDFGMSITTSFFDDTRQLPIRWAAPEVLLDFSQSNVASDVWSFGITLFEIFSFCQEVPYSEMSNEEVISKIMAGYRLPPPKGCPLEIYELMFDCWKQNPIDRPSFKKIYKLLERLEKEASESPDKKSRDIDFLTKNLRLISDHSSLMSSEEINQMYTRKISTSFERVSISGPKDLEEGGVVERRATGTGSEGRGMVYHKEYEEVNKIMKAFEMNQGLATTTSATTATTTKPSAIPSPKTTARTEYQQNVVHPPSLSSSFSKKKTDYQRIERSLFTQQLPATTSHDRHELSDSRELKEPLLGKGGERK